MTDKTVEPARLPPRSEMFTEPAAKAVWAGLHTLSLAEQHQMLEQLREKMAGIGEQWSHQTRARKAIAALRDAASMLGHSPSVADYRHLRAEHPEFGWPADSCVRTWLGSGSWNGALAAARLDRVPDGDTLVRALGPAFTDEEIVDALHEATDELGFVPTFHQYIHWAQRVDVRARAGRRPQSQMPFVRVFGGYIPALRAAELISGDAGLTTRGSKIRRVAMYRVTDDVVAEALQLVARRIGRPPRTTDYVRVREQLIAEALESDDANMPVLPSQTTISKQYLWDDALELAGLPRLGGRSTTWVGRKKPFVPRGPRYNDDQLAATLRAAQADTDGPLTVVAFKSWRNAKIEQARVAGGFVQIPAYDSYYQRYGFWPAALAAAFKPSDDQIDTPEAEAA